MGPVPRSCDSFGCCASAARPNGSAWRGRVEVENPEARSRFLREMQATGKLKHPNIVRALDAEQIGDLLILVMENVAGITLDRLVKQRGPLPVDFACGCIVQAASGLQHAHENGLGHRDIKPANLMITAKEKQVKVLDFGLVRGPRQSMDKNNQTQLQAFMGTPEYVAPEQATDARSADIRADIYSLGCTLYFLLAGQPPFKKDTIVNTIMAQVQDEARPLPELRADVPAGLWTVAAKMLAKKPAERYQTPTEVAKALQPFIGGKTRGADARPVDANAAIDLGAPTALLSRVPRAAVRQGVEESPFAFSSATRELAAPPRPRQKKAKEKRPAWLVGAVVAAGVVLIALLSLVMLTLRTGKGKEVAAAGGEKPPVRPGDASVKPDRVKPPAPEDIAPAASLAAITNSIGMKLVRIEPGTFEMGSPKGEGGSDEEPQHEVEITKAFYLGVYTMTQAEYKEVMGENPSYFSASGVGKEKVIGMNTSKFPVDTVSWEDATKFCEKLNARETEKEAKREYRLPTEAEWEYACRAGTKTKHHSGDDEDDLKRVGWYDANSDSRTHAVGAKNANAWGLYDMHGNVWQWCSDWYGKDY